MPAIKTLKQLRQAVRWYSDTDVGSTNTALDADELDWYINTGLAKLHNILTDAFGAEYFMRRRSITTSDGVSLYDLPADFMELLVAVAHDGSDYCRVHRFEVAHLANLYNAASRGAGSCIEDLRYCLLAKSTGAQNSQLEIQPPPKSSSWTIEIRYIPPVVELHDPGDPIDGVNGWEQYAILWAAIAIKQRDDEDVTVLVSEMQHLEAQIRSLADRRDAGEAPGTIETVDHDSEYEGGSYALIP